MASGGKERVEEVIGKMSDNVGGGLEHLSWWTANVNKRHCCS